MIDKEIIILLALAALTSYALSHLYRRLAIQRGILASVNNRSAHDVPTPTGSGIVLLLVFLLSLIVLSLWEPVASDISFACWGPLIVGIVGYMDDRSELPVRARLPVYILTASWCVYWVGFPSINIGGAILDLGYVGLVLGAISILWLKNLFNFMDGIDGIAASEVVFASFSAAVLFAWSDGLPGDWLIINLLTGCIAAGYLIINWPKAKLFMGDAGANFFGLMLGVLILSGEIVSVWTWLILLSRFIIDTCLTISIRLINRENIHQPHAQHAYQHLNRRFGTTKTLLTTISINIVWLLPLAALSAQFPDLALILLICAALPIAVKDWLCGAGVDAPRWKYLDAAAKTPPSPRKRRSDDSGPIPRSVIKHVDPGSSRG